MTFSIYTLGCKTNQAESAQLESALSERGHTPVCWDEQADAYIINTCTVTAVSDAKCRAVIRRVRGRNPNAVVAVMGCMSQMDEAAVKDIGADIVLGTGNRNAMLSALEASLPSSPGHPAADDLKPRGRTRYFLKIQDGCDNKCSYCIIPDARGRSRSTPADELVNTVGGLERYHEVVLTGIEISSWGRDLLGGPRLGDLVARLCAERPDIRFRLGSIEPATVTDDFIASIASIPNLCEHFHLPLQSGCDSTLRRMARRYNTARFQKALDKIRATYPNAALTTDFIVGFPGEDDDEWAQSLAFLTQCHFARVHVFPFSPRPNTKAAAMEAQVLSSTKRERAAQAAEVGAHTAAGYASGLIGAHLDVVIEKRIEGCWYGHANNYSEVKITAPEHPDLRNCRVKVAVKSHNKAVLEGVVYN